MQAIAGKAEAALVAERNSLEERTRALACDEASKQRVLQRMAEADETLAVYFLTLRETGGTLQEVEAGRVMTSASSLPRVVDVAAAAQAAGNDAIAAVQRGVGGQCRPLRSLVAGRLAGVAEPENAQA